MLLLGLSLCFRTSTIPGAKCKQLFQRILRERSKNFHEIYQSCFFYKSSQISLPPFALQAQRDVFLESGGGDWGGGSWEGPDGLLWHSKVAPSSVGSTRLYVLKDASTRPLTFKFNFLILSLIIQPDGSLAPLSCLRQHASRAYWTRSCGLACWV